MHRNDALKLFTPSASVDLRERPAGGDAALLEVVREAVAIQLRVDGNALRLDPTDETHEALTADASDVPSGAEAETAPLPAPAFAAAATEDDPKDLLIKFMTAEGVDPASSAALAALVPPPLYPEAITLCGHLRAETSAHATATLVDLHLVNAATESAPETPASDALGALCGAGLRLPLCILLRARLEGRAGRGDVAAAAWRTELAQSGLLLKLRTGLRELGTHRSDWVRTRRQAVLCLAAAGLVHLGEPVVEPPPPAAPAVAPAVAPASLAAPLASVCSQRAICGWPR